MKNRIIIAAAAFVPILGLTPSPYAKNYELKDGVFPLVKGVLADRREPTTACTS